MMTEEEFRLEVQKIIDGASPQYALRLQGIQWKCDLIRNKYGDNHVGAMVEISKMMMESIQELHMAFEGRHKEIEHTSTADVVRLFGPIIKDES